MAKLLIGVLLMSIYGSSSFTVDKLNTDEYNTLSAARSKVELAQRELDAVETRIKEAHGQPKPSSSVSASCLQGSTVVELRGEYALITHETHNVCSEVIGR